MSRRAPGAYRRQPAIAPSAAPDAAPVPSFAGADSPSGPAASMGMATSSSTSGNRGGSTPAPVASPNVSARALRECGMRIEYGHGPGFNAQGYRVVKA